jgi:hypothetical protein
LHCCGRSLSQDNLHAPSTYLVTTDCLSSFVVDCLQAHLDAMAMVKLNCLHWHLTDDQSFPWAPEGLLELAEKGAFASEAQYSDQDILDVVEYARYRGIRVIPEVDMPGKCFWARKCRGPSLSCSFKNSSWYMRACLCCPCAAYRRAMHSTSKALPVRVTLGCLLLVVCRPHAKLGQEPP